jgi:hypothetical protein|tara:strand:+ start:1435 stop:1641 length:207 start_codon:yes stop_codon:yes gene_type:complete
MRVTKINTGIYKITIGTRVFEAAKTYDGQWHLSESVDYSHLGLSNELEYQNTFMTLKSCKMAVKIIVK